MNLNKFYERAYTWILNFGPRILVAIVVLFVGWWLIRTLSKALNHSLLRRRVDQTLRPFLLSSVVLILQVLLVLAIMQILGIQLTIFAALVGAFGVAAGLALSGTLQNFTSGILILLLKPFRVSDHILAQGHEGTVTFIRIFYTVVKTFDNRTVIIPNSKLSNEVIVNLSREGRRRLDVELKFNYGVPFEKVKQTLEGTIKEHQNLLKEPAFRIGISSIDPDGYKVMINVWAKAHGYHDIKLHLQEAIVNDILQAGIKLPGT